MLVGVNALHIPPRHGGGAERYLRAVLAKMRDLQPGTRYVLFTDPVNHESFEGWDRVCVDTESRLFFSSEPGRLLAPHTKNAGINVLFSPLATAPADFHVPVVLYTLDLHRWDHEPGVLARRDRADLKTTKRVCANASVLIVPSVFTQRKALRLLEIGLDKTIVAPLGIEDVFGQPQPPLVEPPYLLVVGDTREFKNIPRLREVYAELAKELPHNLVVVGRPCEAEPSDWGSRVIRIEHCPATHLAGLFQHCDVFVQPSLYEGSGITVLEAMRAGAPIATSRHGGIEEVAGDIPVYFNPENTGSILGAIRRILEEDPAQRQQRAKFSRQLAAEYTWEKCAWKTLSAFKRT